jgi:hypothetical protein
MMSWGYVFVTNLFELYVSYNMNQVWKCAFWVRFNDYSWWNCVEGIFLQL